MLLTAGLWAGVVVAATMLAARYVDITIGLVALVQSIVPIAGPGIAALLLITLVARRWPAAIVAAILCAVCASLAVPWFIRNAVADRRDDLVVMSANLQFGGADAQTVARTVREHRVDVLVLVEITPDAVERLRIAGLDTLLPESVGRSSQDAGGTIVRSRIPLTLLSSGSGLAGLAFDEPVVSIHRPGGDVLLRAVHSLPPTPSNAADWRSGLADLQAWREDQPANRPLVMAGDFNASESHPGFRRVADTMTDAHRAAGQGWVRTWPQGRRLIPPFIQLDHVLVRGLEVVDAGVIRLPGSDHAAVWARLSQLGS